MERLENLALVFPRATAERMANSSNESEQVAALLEARVFINGAPVALWPHAGTSESESEQGQSPTDTRPASALGETAVASAPAAAPPAPEPTAARDLSTPALQRQQASSQPLIERMRREMDTTAHFISYAPPALIEFRKAAYPQLSVTTNLSASDWGSQYRVAALAFDRHVSHLVRPLAAMLPPGDPGFDGVVFSRTVRTPGQTADSAPTQSVEFFLPLTDLRRYAQYDLTGPQLLHARSLPV